MYCLAALFRTIASIQRLLGAILQRVRFLLPHVIVLNGACCIIVYNTRLLLLLSVLTTLMSCLEMGFLSSSLEILIDILQQNKICYKEKYAIFLFSTSFKIVKRASLQ